MAAMDSHLHARDEAGPDARNDNRGAGPETSADQLVGELYRAHGLALVRIAMLLVGDKPTAEDVVQDAFAGLYRMSDRLRDPDKALAYLRVSVVNGCRSVHRARRVRFRHVSPPEPAVWSAEALACARAASMELRWARLSANCDSASCTDCALACSVVRAWSTWSAVTYFLASRGSTRCRLFSAYADSALARSNAA